MNITKLFKKYGMDDACPISTPFDTNTQLRKHDGTSQPVDKILYQSIIGSLLYAALGTRPDIQYAVLSISKFSAEPNRSHLHAAKRILRYLKRQKTAYCGIIKMMIKILLVIQMRTMPDILMIGGLHLDMCFFGELEQQVSIVVNNINITSGNINITS